ncbi:CvpA family protein [Enterococcus faecalis]|nr:CvpA family protein [Enterococcus faecalis]
MLTILILLLLAFGFYTGAKRGLILQVLYSVGYLISYFVARTYYKEVASHLELYIPYPSVTPTSKLVFFNQEISLDLNKAFYSAVAFLLLLFAGWLVVRFLAIFLHGLTFIPVLKQVNGLLGGVLSVLVLYVGLFLVLATASMIPSDIVQNQFRSSGLARGIVKNTPILTKQAYELWVEPITK